MVEAGKKVTYTLDELENLTEGELEALVLEKNSDDARYTLGKLLLEGTNDKIKRNEKKGINWIKEAIKNGHLGALEYKTYYDIRFDKQPQMKKLLQNLETIVEKTKGARACNTLAEFYQVQDKKEGSQQEAARHYSMSADQGCQIGIHWVGVFYHLGFGVSKNLEKAIEYLSKSAKEGNGQSYYQLYQIYKEESPLRDIKKAYYNFEKALVRGVSMFDEFDQFFKDNYETLGPIFVQTKKPSALIDKDNKQEVINLHDAFVHEMKNTFSQALSKDRLYLRPVGYLQDQSIWMIGVQTKYFVKKVLRFDHVDFMKAIKQDIPTLLGEIGIWALNNYCTVQLQKGKTEKRKMGQVAIEIIKSYLESGLDYIGQEKKYLFMNKYSPKKCPDQQIKRGSIQFLYSWTHYAPQAWYDHQKKLEEEQLAAEQKKGQPTKKCNFCAAPEGDLRKHKVCSACKVTFYCSADCQKYDWQKTHKVQCKELQKKQKP